MLAIVVRLGEQSERRVPTRIRREIVNDRYSARLAGDSGPQPPQRARVALLTDIAGLARQRPA